MPKSTYTANNHINSVYRGTPYTPPVAIYVALFTVMPTVSGGGTEVTGGSYARQLVTFGAPSGGISSNDIAVTYPIASANWGSIAGYAYFDSATSGNMLSFNPLSAARSVTTGDQVVFNVGQLIIQET